MKKMLAALALGFSTVSALASTCYTMLDAKEAVVYRSTTVPIDLSRSITSEMRDKYPKLYFFFTTDGRDCHETNNLHVAETQAPETSRSASLVKSEAAATALNKKQQKLIPDDGAAVIASPDNSLLDSNFSNPTAAYGPGKNVSVRSYTRSNGTVVAAHTRSSRRR